MGFKTPWFIWGGFCPDRTFWPKQKKHFWNFNSASIWNVFCEISVINRPLEKMKGWRGSLSCHNVIAHCTWGSGGRYRSQMDRPLLALPVTPKGDLESPINLTCMFRICGRKPEEKKISLGKNPADMWVGFQKLYNIKSCFQPVNSLTRAN